MLTKKTYFYSGNIRLFSRMLFLWVFVYSIPVVAQALIISSENITQSKEDLISIPDSVTDSSDYEKEKSEEHQIQNISNSRIYIIGETSLIGADEIFNSDITHIDPPSSSERPTVTIARKQENQKKKIPPAIFQQPKGNLFTLRSPVQNESPFEIIAKTAKVSLATQHNKVTACFPGCISFFKMIFKRPISLFYNNEYSFAEKFFISGRAPPFLV
ncbi:hypothetical protein [Chryseobacterium sp.]|uniref:hypothetical protein n=1 Tax=Chryseobacterium sp. TaxID=1871047 RepID=UPI0024E1A974|nr:hypothetical protein [Chryseobacterium sp.]